jgi:hypothetical protein
MAAQLTLYVAVLIFMLTPSAARMEYRLIGLALLLSCLAETAGFIGQSPLHSGSHSHKLKQHSRLGHN